MSKKKKGPHLVLHHVALCLVRHPESVAIIQRMGLLTYDEAPSDENLASLTARLLGLEVELYKLQEIGHEQQTI